jgi:hypothetical protein
MKQLRVLELNKAYSLHNLNQIRTQIINIPELKNDPDYCSFATGAFSRLDANKYSGIDIFFITKGNHRDHKKSNIKKTLIDAELINIIEKLGLPPLSDDGALLKTIYLDNILTDPQNISYAPNWYRLLLILESTPLYNNELYDEIIRALIIDYYKCYSKAILEPSIFLMQDIILYWKKQCLDYWHIRNFAFEDDNEDMFNHVATMKLSFSHKITCYSFIAQIIAHLYSINVDKIAEIVKMTPLERLMNLKEIRPDVNVLVDNAVELYSGFLELMNLGIENLFQTPDSNIMIKDVYQKGDDLSQTIHEILLLLSDRTHPHLIKQLLYN